MIDAMYTIGEKSTKKASNFFKKNSVLKSLVYIVFCVGPKKKKYRFWVSDITILGQILRLINFIAMFKRGLT